MEATPFRADDEGQSARMSLDAPPRTMPRRVDERCEAFIEDLAPPSCLGTVLRRDAWDLDGGEALGDLGHDGTRSVIDGFIDREGIDQLCLRHGRSTPYVGRSRETQELGLGLRRELVACHGAAPGL